MTEFSIPSLTIINIDIIPSITLMQEDRNSISDEIGMIIKNNLPANTGISAVRIRTGFILRE